MPKAPLFIAEFLRADGFVFPVLFFYLFLFFGLFIKLFIYAKLICETGHKCLIGGISVVWAEVMSPGCELYVLHTNKDYCKAFT